MKRKVGVLFLVLAASLMFCSASMAENRAKAWSVTPFIGGQHFNSDTPLDKALIYGVRVGYNLTKAWSLEGMASFGQDRNYEVVPGGGYDEDAKIINYRLEALYNFTPDKKFVPFIAAGVGGRNISYDNSYYNDDAYSKNLVISYGLGFKFFFAEDWAMRADVRHLFMPNDSLHNLEYTLGISYFFGGKKPAIPEPAPGPAPGPVKPAPEPYYEDSTPSQKCPNTPSDLMVDKDGCPIKVTVNMNVLFDFDKANVKPKYHEELKRVSDYMHAYPWETAVLEGHTDSKGTDAYNMKLSQRRVDNIKKYLVEKLGVSADRLTAVGYGESRPIATNDTDEGRQLNRRVQAVMETYIKKQH
jgi:OOP family OmpA-OmpF porin